MKIQIDRDQVRRIFETAKTPDDYLLGMYRMAFAEWDSIKSIQGWPAVSRATSEELFRLAIAADTRIMRDNAIQGCMAGGSWLNSGFGSKSDLPDWQIDVSTCTIEMSAQA